MLPTTIQPICNIFIRSALSHSVTGSSMMIKRLMTSANKRTQEPISFTISFIKTRKSNGPIIEPYGTPANFFSNLNRQQEGLHVVFCQVSSF